VNKTSFSGHSLSFVFSNDMTGEENLLLNLPVQTSFRVYWLPDPSKNKCAFYSGQGVKIESVLQLGHYRDEIIFVNFVGSAEQVLAILPKSVLKLSGELQTMGNPSFLSQLTIVYQSGRKYNFSDEYSLRTWRINSHSIDHVKAYIS
jgi:hypothetical protein